MTLSVAILDDSFHQPFFSLPRDQPRWPAGRSSASRCPYPAGNTRSLSEHGSQAAWADDSAMRESRSAPGHSSRPRRPTGRRGRFSLFIRTPAPLRELQYLCVCNPSPQRRHLGPSSSCATQRCADPLSEFEPTRSPPGTTTALQRRPRPGRVSGAAPPASLPEALSTDDDGP